MPELIDRERLAAAVQRTLEDAAFLFAEPVEEPPPFGPEVLEARLSWSGPGAPELRLATSPELAAELAANLLGVEDAPDAGPDALGELLNMAAGAIVAAIFGPRDARRRLLPSVARVDAGTHDRGIADALVAVALVDEEGRRIDVALVRGRESA